MGRHFQECGVDMGQLVVGEEKAGMDADIERDLSLLFGRYRKRSVNSTHLPRNRSTSLIKTNTNG
jgi:hypothetical protein